MALLPFSSAKPKAFLPDQFTLIKAAVLATPQTVSGNATAAFDGLHTIYLYVPKSSHSEIYAYDINAGTVTAITNGTIIDEGYDGAAMIYVAGKLYLTRGGGYGEFARINIDGTGYTFLTNCPTGINFGCGIAWDGNDLIYLINATPALQKYSISGNSWTTLAAPLSGSNTEGLSLVMVDPSTIYALKGGGTTTFWRYNVVSDAWTALASLPGTVQDGGGLAWSGGDFLYAYRGLGSQNFYRYHFATNTWQTLGNLPIPASTGSTIFPLGGGNFLCYISEPSGITAFGIVNNVYVYNSYQALSNRYAVGLPLAGGTLGGNLNLDYSNPGGGVQLAVINESTVALSQAGFYAQIDGASTGDLYWQFSLNGITDWILGMDNSDSDKFKIGPSYIVGLSTALTIDVNGKVGIGTESPAGLLHAGAGSTTVPPFIITPGTNVTTPVSGVHEYNGNHYLTQAGLVRYSVGGTLFDHYADTGNTHTDGVTFDDLYSDTTAANTFNTNGDKITAEFSGIFVGSTSTKEIKVVFAGTTILDSGSLAIATAESWDIQLMIIRESSTVVRCIVNFKSTTSVGASVNQEVNYARITSLTLSNTNILKITGVSGGAGAAANDIVAKMGSIYFKPAI